MKVSSCLSVLFLPYLVTAIDKPAGVLSTSEDQHRTGATTTAVNGNTGGRHRGLQFFFSPGEWSCKSDLNKCVANKKPGSLDLQGWMEFLEKQVSGDDENGDSILGKFQSSLHEASQVNLAQAFGGLESLSETAIGEFVGRLEDLVESVKEEETSLLNSELDSAGAISENGLDGKCQAVAAFFDGELEAAEKFFFGFGPFGRALFLGFFLVFQLIFTPTFGIPCTVIGPLLGLVQYETALSLLRRSAERAFTGTPGLRSSPFCEAKLLTCEHEALLAETVPAVLEALALNEDHQHD